MIVYCIIFSCQGYSPIYIYIWRKNTNYARNICHIFSSFQSLRIRTLRFKRPTRFQFPESLQLFHSWRLTPSVLAMAAVHRNPPMWHWTASRGLLADMCMFIHQEKLPWLSAKFKYMATRQANHQVNIAAGKHSQNNQLLNLKKNTIDCVRHFISHYLITETPVPKSNAESGKRHIHLLWINIEK